MGLRDRVENDRLANRRNAVDRFLDALMPSGAVDEALELLNDREVSATVLSRAIAAEYDVKLSVKVIRDWRINHGSQGQG